MDPKIAKCWLERLEGSKVSLKWTDQEAAKRGCQMLRKERLWFDHLDSKSRAEVSSSWEVFKAEFIKSFGIDKIPPPNFSNLLIRQESDESVQDFSFKVTMSVSEYFGSILPEMTEEFIMKSFDEDNPHNLTLPEDPTIIGVMPKAVLVNLDREMAKKCLLNLRRNYILETCRKVFLDGLLPYIRIKAWQMDKSSFEKVIEAAKEVERAYEGLPIPATIEGMKT